MEQPQVTASNAVQFTMELRPRKQRRSVRTWLRGSSSSSSSSNESTGPTTSPRLRSRVRQSVEQASVSSSSSYSATQPATQPRARRTNAPAKAQATRSLPPVPSIVKKPRAKTRGSRKAPLEAKLKPEAHSNDDADTQAAEVLANAFSSDATERRLARHAARRLVQAVAPTASLAAFFDNVRLLERVSAADPGNGIVQHVGALTYCLDFAASRIKVSEGGAADSGTRRDSGELAFVEALVQLLTST